MTDKIDTVDRVSAEVWTDLDHVIVDVEGSEYFIHWPELARHLQVKHGVRRMHIPPHLKGERVEVTYFGETKRQYITLGEQ